MSGDKRLLPGGDDSRGAVSVLGNSRQRRILAVLQDRAHPMTVRDLAVRLAADEAGTDASAVSREDRRSIRVDLHHRCLPKLESAGWIDRQPEGVVADDPPPLADETPSFLERSDADPPAPEAVDALLARPRRRELVSILADRDRRISLSKLATELAARDADSQDQERGDEPSLRCTLHHVDLPRLAEVGLLEYDRDERTVTPTEDLKTFVDGTVPDDPKTDAID